MRPIAGPVLAALALYVALMAVYVAKHGGDPATLLCVGENRAGAHPFELIRSAVGPNGYDGQFYYAIAQNPWRPHEGERIDNPPARHLRILYPAVCWALGGGDPRALPWVMPAVNLLALGTLAGMAAWFALRHGRSPWWGVGLPVALNTGMAALHNLTDPLSAVTVFGLVAAWLTGARPGVTAVWAALALLSREQNLAIVGVVGLAALRDRRFLLAAGLGASVLLWVGWVGVLRSTYGTSPFIPGGVVFTWPFGGMVYRWSHPGGNDHFSRRLAVLLVASMVHLTLQIGLAAYLLSRRKEFVASLCMLGGVALALVSGEAIFCDFWSYNRVFAWLPLGIWLYSLRRDLVWPAAALLPSFLWTLAAALRYV